MKKNYVGQLCFCSVLAAFCFVLDYCATLLNSVSGVFKLPLGALPIIIAAVQCGPLMGAAVGLTGTFLTQLITYGLTPTTVLWILPAGIRGVCMGLLFIAFKRSLETLPLTLEITISSVIVTAINTLVIYLDSVIYSYYSPAVVWGGLLTRVITAVISSFVFALILPPVVRVIDKRIKKQP